MADTSEMMDLGRSVFDLISTHFDRDPTGETTINGKCGVALIAFIRSALHPSPTPVSAPVGVVEAGKAVLAALEGRVHSNPALSSLAKLRVAIEAHRSPAVVEGK